MVSEGRMTDDQLEIIWTKTIVTYSRNHLGTWVEALRKTMVNLRHDSRFPGRDSNRKLPEYE
jgi:hypothetical protein